MDECLIHQTNDLKNAVCFAFLHWWGENSLRWRKTDNNYRTEYFSARQTMIHKNVIKYCKLANIKLNCAYQNCFCCGAILVVCLLAKDVFKNLSGKRSIVCLSLIHT